MASCSFPSPISFKPHSSHARKLLHRGPPERLERAHSKKPLKPDRNRPPTHPNSSSSTHAQTLRPRSSEATISNKHELRLKLDMCSKSGDVISALSLYDSAREQGLELDQYHYNVLLYLCSSASVGVIHRAKSGNQRNHHNSSSRTTAVRVISDDVRAYARTRGLEMYETMRSEGVPMSEAALTSVARLAMSVGDGEAAFDAVRRMEELGIPRRLRSYAPAILAFCGGDGVDKAFNVLRHMEESGILPEEPELEALLRASVRLRRGDKVYCLLHKLRTNVRQVSPSVAEVIEDWFGSPTASRVGKRKWDGKAVERAAENGGGGWHGLGWLGRGKWAVARVNVDDDGVCCGCGDKLVTIDLDPVETENFARSVVDIASKRERSSSFQKFQRWLDYYGPFEAVVDAANVGLFCQRQFSLTKVNAVVNAIRQKIPSRKWPLIILHNRRLTGRKMVEPLNEKVIEKWKNADAIYATPTGSNDDWYWLYAAIKCKCLLVTNDEMRDHLFQILGNDFFPKWKERHQVHFSFQDGSFTFHMPPPCSIVIQKQTRMKFRNRRKVIGISPFQKIANQVEKGLGYASHAPIHSWKSNVHRLITKKNIQRRCQTMALQVPVLEARPGSRLKIVVDWNATLLMDKKKIQSREVPEEEWLTLNFPSPLPFSPRLRLQRSFPAVSSIFKYNIREWDQHPGKYVEKYRTYFI